MGGLENQGHSSGAWVVGTSSTVAVWIEPSVYHNPARLSKKLAEGPETAPMSSPGRPPVGHLTRMGILDYTIPI